MGFRPIRARSLTYIYIVINDLVYTDATVVHPYEAVGCFKDANLRALPILIRTYHVNEEDLANSFAAIIHSCATEVYNYGYWYFGLEYRMECWSGVNGYMTYDRHGRSEDCFSSYGVGGLWTTFVYRFVEG